MIERPYYSDGPLPPGVVARVQMARSALTWLAEVEAYLVEQGLTTELAPAVCKFMDAFGCTVEYAVARIQSVLEPAVMRPCGHGLSTVADDCPLCDT